MGTPSLRPSRPLNVPAVGAADKALYQAHENDPRPNALFDPAGRKKPLSGTDPAQAPLRREWLAQYAKNGGQFEQDKLAGSQPVGSAVQPCPLQKARLLVNVRYIPLDAPVEKATVTIRGPVTRTLATNCAGEAQFEDLPPGSYAVETEYKATHPLVELAKKQEHSTDWAHANARGPYPADTNKCNLFVYEMVTGAGHKVPERPFDTWKGLGPTVMLPPLAGDWADPAKAMGTSTIVTHPEPGDVIAWSHPYADASGHVGIVTYPQPVASVSQQLAECDDASVTVQMRRQSISAHEKEVGEGPATFWHFYDEGNTSETSRIVFRRFP